MNKKEELLKLKYVLERIKSLIESDIHTITNEDIKDNINLNISSDQIKNIYRFHHIEYFDITKDSKSKVKLKRSYLFMPFILPIEITEQEAFKFISYLTDYLKNTYNIPRNSLKLVIELNRILYLEKLGFKRIICSENDNKIKDIFSIDGITTRFKYSKEYCNYFNWYTPNVTKQEFVNICNKLGITFKDISLNEIDVKSKENQLKL